MSTAYGTIVAIEKSVHGITWKSEQVSVMATCNNYAIVSASVEPKFYYDEL